VSVLEPARDARVNVIGTVAVLAAARQHRAPVIFASTGGAIYGEVPGPVDEHFPERPPSPYGAAKLASEVYLAQDARLHGGAHVALRFANVYGPRQDPHGEAGVVAIFAGRVLAGTPATVFGDGAQTRDYVYVADVVRALQRAGEVARRGDDEHLRDSGATIPVFNVGTGVETSVVDLWRAMCAAHGVELGCDLQPARIGEIQRSVLDATLLARELDVRPETTLHDGLRATIAWLAERAALEAGAGTPT
jgi:UDP-glucose 4-epimerase